MRTTESPLRGLHRGTPRSGLDEKGRRQLVVDRIYTDRHRVGHSQPARHLIYEWEDDLSEGAGTPLADAASARTLLNHRFGRLMHRVPGLSAVLRAYDSFHGRAHKSLYFTMWPEPKGALSTRARVIPIIIDYWKTVDLRTFSRAYNNCSLVLISSLEALQYLRDQSCPLNLRHFPLSLSDRYALDSAQPCVKQFDVLIAGRACPVMMDFMRRYVEVHRDVEYVHQLRCNGEFFYVSNRRGVLGAFNDRASYMGLLRQARVGLYSTPGMDGGETRTGGFNPVTPRLFELLSAGCHVVARYPENPDTAFFGLNEICPSIDSYDAFASRLDTLLHQPPPTARNSAYLKQHYTSTRATLLREILHGQG